MRISTFGLTTFAVLAGSLLVDSQTQAAIVNGSIDNYQSDTYELPLTGIQDTDVVTMTFTSVTGTAITSFGKYNVPTSVTWGIKQIDIIFTDLNGNPLTTAPVLSVMTDGIDKTSAVNNSKGKVLTTSVTESWVLLPANTITVSGAVINDLVTRYGYTSILMSADVKYTDGTNMSYMYDGAVNFNYEIVSTPEAASLGMLGAGALLLARRRK